MPTEKCGCKYDAERWLKLCPEHQTETDVFHARWAQHKAWNDAGIWPYPRDLYAEDLKRAAKTTPTPQTDEDEEPWT